MKEISALNEQLLRSIGFGIALYSAKSEGQIFANEAFSRWFAELEPGHGLADALQMDDLSALHAALRDKDTFDLELKFRIKRRQTVIALSISLSRVGEEGVFILQAQNITRIRELETMIESYSSMVERNARVIEREKAQVEKLLLNILPKGAYEEYKTVGVVTPARYDDCAILHLDFVEFHDALEQMAPASFVAELNELHTAFDRIAEQFGCERIKTTGDSYILISGLQDRGTHHGQAICETALRFVRYLARRNEVGEQTWSCRIGLAQGPVLGSVVGNQRYVYDVIGPAVADAAAALSRANAMQISVHSSIEEAPEGHTLAALSGGFQSLEPTQQTIE